MSAILETYYYNYESIYYHYRDEFDDYASYEECDHCIEAKTELNAYDIECDVKLVEKSEVEHLQRIESVFEGVIPVYVEGRYSVADLTRPRQYLICGTAELINIYGLESMKLSEILDYLHYDTKYLYLDKDYVFDPSCPWVYCHYLWDLEDLERFEQIGTDIKKLNGW